MADPVNFANNYFAMIDDLIKDLELLRTLNDRIVQDGTLITEYFSSPSPRSDLVAADITNAASAINQLLFAFDSGAPTQKSYLFKLL